MKWRTIIGIICIIFFSLFQSLRALKYYDPLIALKKIQRGGQIPSDFLTIYKKNIACILPELSPSQVVGFVTSVPNKRQERDAIYHMTQFAIVPFLLEDSLDYELVVAYYPNRIRPKPEIPMGFSVVKICTDEVFLLERIEQ